MKAWILFIELSLNYQCWLETGEHKNIALLAISSKLCQKARYNITRLPGDSRNIEKLLIECCVNFFMFLNFFLFSEIMIQLYHFNLPFPPPSKYSYSSPYFLSNSEPQISLIVVTYIYRNITFSVCIHVFKDDHLVLDNKLVLLIRKKLKLRNSLEFCPLYFLWAMKCASELVKSTLEYTIKLT